jgi:hypothetical protein
LGKLGLESSLVQVHIDRDEFVNSDCARLEDHFEKKASVTQAMSRSGTARSAVVLSGSMSGSRNPFGTLAAVLVLSLPFDCVAAGDRLGHSFGGMLDLSRAEAQASALTSRFDAASPRAVTYGLVDLPVQRHGIDVYAIAGLVPVKSVLNAIVSLPELSACPGCDVRPSPPHHAHTTFAGGAGSQLKLGSWAVRLECQCFIHGGHPGFFSVGFTRNVF